MKFYTQDQAQAGLEGTSICTNSEIRSSMLSTAVTLGLFIHLIPVASWVVSFDKLTEKKNPSIVHRLVSLIYGYQKESQLQSEKAMVIRNEGLSHTTS